MPNWMRLLAGCLFLLGGLPAWASCPVPQPGQAPPREARPEAMDWAPWRLMADALTARLRTTDVARTRLVFIGDSITQHWEEHVFRNFYGHRAPLNLGIGGDVTQSLLWRLENGHWPAQLKPEAIVLLIGTNNIGSGAQPQAVAHGISRIIERLQQLAPQARIVLVGILPRGITATDRMRLPIAEVNRMIASCGDGRRVFYTEPGQLMLDGQGVLFDWIAPDWIHLSLTGYAILSAAIEGHLRLALQR